MSTSSKEGVLKVFAGNANRELAEAIASYLGTTLSPAEVSRFSDGMFYLPIMH